MKKIFKLALIFCTMLFQNSISVEFDVNIDSERKKQWTYQEHNQKSKKSRKIELIS